MRHTALVVLVGVAALLTMAATELPEIGAGALLHPARRPITVAPPAACVDIGFTGDDVRLRGWRCSGVAPRRGTVVFLHGIADNRASARGLVARFTQRGFDLVAYDSRAHGASAGDACTYGFFEKRDLHRVIDSVAPGPVVLIGESLGAAVALQEAADDPRVAAVVAAESFSDLRTVATERAPIFFPRWAIARAFARAEQAGMFDVDAVSPVRAAARMTRPVLVIHGDSDVDTPPDHARGIFAALAGPKRLVLVRGARHNQSLRGPEIWREIDAWIDGILGHFFQETRS